MFPHRTWSILLLAISLEGCAVIDFFGGTPMKKDSIPLSSNAEVSQVFDCVKKVVAELHIKNAFWGKNVDYENLDAGILEMENYSKSGPMGFKVRAEIKKDQNVLVLRLKGVGILYMDLGVSEGMVKLKTGVSRCVST